MAVMIASSSATRAWPSFAPSRRGLHHEPGGGVGPARNGRADHGHHGGRPLGSAFAAEIGVMQTREEVDALKVMGIEPMQVLVVPRVIALVITLPLLAFFADIMGLVGGAAISQVLLNVSPTQYLARLPSIVDGSDLFVGLFKAPVFAFFIAAIGCMHGLRVTGSAESVGRETTRAVVKSIFMVIRARCAVLHPVREARHMTPRSRTHAEPILSARGIVNRFGRQVVHDGLGLDIMRGEIIGIAGGSGSGKSVLLKTLVGLREPDAGEILLNGEAVRSMSAADKASQIGVLFQQGALFSSLSVARTSCCRCANIRRCRTRIQEHIAAMKLALAGLPADAGVKFPSALSGGMVKRAAFARALALDRRSCFSTNRPPISTRSPRAA